MKKIGTLLLTLLGGALFGYLLAKYLLPPAASGMMRWQKLSIFLFIPLFGFLAILVHELGHVAFGRWQDFDFFGLTVGPFHWHRDEAGKLRLKRNRNLNTAGGVALMLPNGDGDLRNRFRWYALGGPLFSLFLLALGVGGSYLLGAYPFVSTLLFLAGAISGGIFLATAIPFQANGMMSDGKRFLTLSRDSDQAAASIAGVQGLSQLRAGRPYAELPMGPIERGLASREDIHPSERAGLLFYRYLHAVDRGDLDTAEDSLDQVIASREHLMEAATYSYYLTRAFFHARYRRNLEAARADFEQYQENPFTQPGDVALTRAAIADLSGDLETLAAQLPLIEAGLPGLIDRTAVPTYREWLREWRERLAEPT